MGKELKKKKPLPWWRRILLGLILIAMGLLTALMLASYVVGRQLGAEVINISEAGEPLTFSDLEAGLGQSTAGEDAARYYFEALMSIKPWDVGDLARVNTFYRRNILFLPANQFPDKLRERITQNLVDSRPVLEKFDKGAALPLSHFDIGIEQGIQVCATNLRRVRTAAFLLSLRTLNLALQGEDENAADSAIIMLKMIRIFDTRPIMVLHAAKVALVGLVCEDIRLLLERGRLSEKSLAKLQKALLEAIPANTLERMFFGERVYQLEIGRNLIPEDITSRLLQDKVPDLPERVLMPGTFRKRLRIRQRSTWYLRNMAWLITAARRPWPEPLDVIVDNAPASAGKPSKLVSSAVPFVRLTGEVLAFMRCTVLAIAIERYRFSNGELPSSLDDICPGYIDSVLLDPYTGKKLLYSRDEETYVVYSAGIDRQDDSGSIMPEAGEKGSRDRGLRIHFRKPE